MSRTSRKLRYVAEYGDGVLNDTAVYRQSLNLDLLLFRSRSQLNHTFKWGPTYRSSEFQNRFPGDMSFFRIILDIEVDDMYWSVEITSPRQKVCQRSIIWSV